MTDVQRPFAVFPPLRDGVDLPSDYGDPDARPVRRVTTPYGATAWLVSRYADARAVLRSRGLSSDPRNQGFPAFVGFRQANAEGQIDRFPVVDMDPPEHTNHRMAIVNELTSDNVAKWTPRIEALTTGLLDSMEESGSPADLMASFANDLPALVITELLGYPADERQYFQQLHHEFESVHTDASRRLALDGELNDYVEAQVRAHETARGDGGFFDRLLTARDEGKVPPEAVVPLARITYAAGVDTTADAIGTAVIALLRNPDQAAMLRDGAVDPSHAVEELLRWTSIVSGLSRIATKPIDVGGETIDTGDGVLVALPAVNHDPDVYPSPERLDLSRDPARIHMAFGQGLHQCPGMKLAKVEMELALPALLRRFPNLALAVPESELVYKNGFVQGVEKLPVTW